MTRDDLRAALGDAQIAAFLHVIREGESNQNDDAYTLLNGGGHFSSFADHPFSHQSAPPGKAAGAYQFIPHTWDGLVSRYGFTNFSPQCQDEGAVALILEQHSGDAIKAGQVATACQILGRTWVSLPLLGTARAERTFVKFGGTLPVLEPGTTTQPEPPSTAPQGGSNMPFLALLPLIAQFIPQIMTLIKPNSVSTAKDAQVAGTILDTVVKAAGIVTADGAPAPVNATTVAQAADKMAADPALAKQVQTAVVTHPDVMELLQVGEVGGGIAAARTANAPLPDAAWWSGFSQPVFVFGLILSGMIIMILGNMLGMTWAGAFQSWSNEVRASVVSGVVMGGLGAITGYWFGTTLQSAKKDAVIAQQAGANPPNPNTTG